MQFTAFDVEASHFCRAPRHGGRAIVFLGQALQPGTCVHRFTTLAEMICEAGGPIALDNSPSLK